MVMNLLVNESYQQQEAEVVIPTEDCNGDKVTNTCQLNKKWQSPGQIEEKLILESKRDDIVEDNMSSPVDNNCKCLGNCCCSSTKKELSELQSRYNSLEKQNEKLGAWIKYLVEELEGLEKATGVKRSNVSLSENQQPVPSTPPTTVLPFQTADNALQDVAKTTLPLSSSVPLLPLCNPSQSSPPVIVSSSQSVRDLKLGTSRRQRLARNTEKGRSLSESCLSYSPWKSFRTNNNNNKSPKPKQHTRFFRFSRWTTTRFEI